ncbi:MAG: hypothetical protein J2P37_14775, partial [Ktedonobacteraceae bacterium]|nr:hypothetical protein [Ktedonobacteraceae bacterium]
TRYGDGAATAAVLAHALVRGGLKLLAAGFSPALLRRGIDHGVSTALHTLTEQARPIQDEEDLAHLATSVTGYEELGRLLGEIVATLGENTSLLVEEHPTPCLDRAYLTGGRWPATPGSYLLIPDGKAALELAQPLLFLTDENLETVEQVLPALEQALAFPNHPPLLVVARHVQGQALTTLLTNHTRGVLTVGIALLQTEVQAITDDLEDIALLTGGQVMTQITGHAPQHMQPACFGRARKATLSRDQLVLVEGAGDPQQVRQRIGQVRAQIKQLPRNEDAWQKQSQRLGRLSGGLGLLKIGAYTQTERMLLKEQAERAVPVLTTALEGGVVPGGGVAYLNCITAVESAAQTCAHPDEAAGMRLVAQALAAPFAQIVRNHGQWPAPLMLDEARRRGPAYGFDALRGEVCALAERGIFDPLAVIRAALEQAAGLAAMLMSIDAVILRD